MRKKLPKKSRREITTNKHKGDKNKIELCQEKIGYLANLPRDKYQWL